VIKGFNLIDFVAKEGEVWYYANQAYEIPSKHFKEAEDYKAIYRDDTKNLLAIVSKDYSLIQHRDVFEVFTSSLEARNIEYEKCVIRTWKHGARAYMDFHFPEKLEVKQGDELIQGLTVINSLDGSLRLNVRSFVERLICTNGAHGLVREDIAKRKHIGLNLEAVVDLITIALNELETLEDRVRTLLESIIDREEGLEALDKLVIPEKYKKSAEKYFQHFKEVNLWDFYNMLTYDITHKWTGKDLEARRKLEKEVAEIAFTLAK